MADDGFERAILDEGLKKGALVWLEVAGRSHARWHAWTGEHVYLLTGQGEQPDPGLQDGSTVRVVVRSKDNRHRMLAFDADVSVLTPEADDWGPATAALTKERLNLHDSDGAVDRWASNDFVLYRLTPLLPLAEAVDDISSDSHRAVPPPTEATTAGPPPRVLHRRGTSGRRLS